LLLALLAVGRQKSFQRACREIVTNRVHLLKEAKTEAFEEGMETEKEEFAAKLVPYHPNPMER
jgi:hypothetical protein